MRTQSAEEKNPMLNVFSIRDFRLLFMGVATSLLGDQFTLIATPWLVLQLTGDPLALGIVLALGGIPLMSLLMLASAGLVPVSQAIAGAVSTWDLTLLFVTAGGLIVLMTSWMAYQPALVTFSNSLSENNLFCCY